MSSRAVCVAQPVRTASPFDRYEALFDTLMSHHYEVADSMCSEFDSIWPGHPASHYARASVIYAQLCDFEDTTGTARLEFEAEKCLTACELWEEQAPDSAEAEREYLIGAAYSVSGLTRHRQGKTVDGIRRLMTSRSHFDRAIEVDPEFYDAYVGRGAYRYAAAQNLGFLRWLPGVPSKKQGWADLTLGLGRAKFSRFAALSSMVWLVLQEENYELADSMVKAGLERFPNSRTFLMPKLALEKKTSQWKSARETAHELMLSQYKQLEFQNGYEVIGLYRTLMDCSDMLGETEAALNYARAGLDATATPYALERRKDTLKALRARLSRKDAR
ncbi:MAG: hypothetical protein IPP40_05745 [bacterium]|nr:hypothetical protein [bacterium]